MRYIWQHIQSITTVYNGGIPLTHFLKNYYRQNSKLGSRDRKIISEMVYSWYRCSKAMSAPELSFEEKVMACTLLCSSEGQPAVRLLPEAWQAAMGQPTEERIKLLQEKQINFDIARLLPYDVQFSDGMNREVWLYSMLVQPRLFIRIRKQKEKIVQLLGEHGIAFEFVSDTCLSLPNGAGIDKLLPEDSYVVQDASSQETGSYFHPRPNELWYDCCSGAGGKSLLLKDTEPKVKLTVSDKRDSIIHNLKQRFKLYHHTLPNSFVIDVSNRSQLELLGNVKFDNIICDVPCSGSGTWARTPEQLYFFEPEVVDTISLLQRTIAINAASKLKGNGRLLYITCSVFYKENEAVINEVVATTGLTLEEMHIINGIDKQADSMFITVLKKRA